MAVVHGPKLNDTETPCGAPEALGVGVYDRGLLDQDPRLVAVKLDRRSERGWPGSDRLGETSVVLRAMNSSA
ncbi:MAG: hypothetical protein QOI84_177 [Solirubrobacterales bacterium]|nr:hypothetical protein [Solirubrobacterales bacterium]